MGRMLDALKRNDSRHGEDNLVLPLEPTKAPAALPVDDLANECAYPFIEVGAPGKKVEASPEILALMPRSAPVAAPPAPAAPTSVVAKEAITAPATVEPTGRVAAQLHETAPLNIAFAPWPTAVPPRAVAAEILAYHQPDHALSKQYQALFGQLVDGLPPGESAAWLLCGRSPRVGCTTVLLNLAAAGGKQNKYRLVAVDANLRQPTLGQRLGQGQGPGIADILVGHVGLEQAVQATVVPNLHVLPAGAAKGGPTMAWTAEAAQWLLAWLRERFDVVLVDGPCLDETLPLAALAPCCNGLFLVTPRNETAGIQQGSLPRAIARLGGKLRGVIETHIEG